MKLMDISLRSGLLMTSKSLTDAHLFKRTAEHLWMNKGLPINKYTSHNSYLWSASKHHK